MKKEPEKCGYMRGEIEQALFGQGYRLCRVQPDEVEVFYKYYQEGFHVVMTVDLEYGYQMTAEQQRILENRVLDLFYHPQGRLADFPEGFPVYHVEPLTLLIGGSAETAREICGACRNIWVYRPTEQRLIIYENQPGDFWGLRRVLEGLDAGGTNRQKPPAKRSRGIKALPFATIVIAAINLIVYIVLEILGDTEDGLFIAAHGGMYPGFIIYDHQWWRILIFMFIHFGLPHLVNNMVIFCCIGSRLERAVGHWKLAVIYLLSGIGGGLLSLAAMVFTGDYAVAVGASGAVFGTIGGLLWAVIMHRGSFEGLTTRGLVLMAALSLYYGFSTIGVDNWSHIGGIVTGFLTTLVLYHRKSQKC